MLRMIQAGTGSRRPLIVLFLVGPQMDRAIRDAVGPRATIVADVVAQTDPDMGAIRKWAADHSGAAMGELILGGWSLGCSRVRSLLQQGEQPVAVVLADGTTNTLPPDPAKARVWSDLVGRGRDGSCVVAVSCSYNVYTERLRPPEQPYQATINTMRAATGWALSEPADSVPGAMHDNDLHLYTYRSADIDAEAHRRQLTDALPMMLREHVAPLTLNVVQGDATATDDAVADTLPDAADEAPPTQPATMVRSLSMGSRGEDVRELQRLLNQSGVVALTVDGMFGPRTRAAVAQIQQRWGVAMTGEADRDFVGTLRTSVAGTARTLSQAALAAAREDLARGVHETPGRPNDGPLIRTLYLNPLGVAPGSNWCAAAVSSWIRRAAKAIGVAMPVAGSAGAKALAAQFQQQGRFIPANKVTPDMLVPGVVVFFNRGAPGSWEGHACIITERAIAGTYASIDGNSGANSSEVARMVRRVDDPSFYGIGLLDRGN